MWLLKTNTLELEYFVDERATRYCILSHTWGSEEVTFQEISGEPPQFKKGFCKIKQTCRQAIEDGYNHVWIDTCCINKQSSAELSEAINSMFSYYAAANVCYVYLEDVSTGAGDIAESDRHAHGRWIPSKRLMEAAAALIQRSRWITRGWTLQELVAPKTLRFFDSSWNYIGGRYRLAQPLAALTRIDLSILEGNRLTDLNDYSIAARMSWAANRQTTRREDRAYCLLGLFQINMPLLYGEGDRAFQRLQEEIFQRTDDMSILAWNCRKTVMTSACAIFAPSSNSFQDMSQVVRWRSAAPIVLRLLNVSVEIEAPLISNQSKDEHYLVLNCHFRNNLIGPLAMCVEGSFVRSKAGADFDLASSISRLEDEKGGRLRVISYDLVARAKTQKYSLYPRFSFHDHGVERYSELAAPALQDLACTQMIMNVPDNGAYVIDCLERYPQQMWNSSGMFQLPFNDSTVCNMFTPAGRSKPSDAMKAHCTLRVLTRTSEWQILRTIDVIKVQLDLRLSRQTGKYELVAVHLVDLESTPSVALQNDPTSGQQVRLAAKSSHAYIRLQSGLCLALQLKQDQKVMDTVIDVVMLSVVSRKTYDRDSQPRRSRLSSGRSELRGSSINSV